MGRNYALSAALFRHLRRATFQRPPLLFSAVPGPPGSLSGAVRGPGLGFLPAASILAIAALPGLGDVTVPGLGARAWVSAFHGGCGAGLGWG